MTNLPPAKIGTKTSTQDSNNGGAIALTLIDFITFGAGSSIGHSIINKISELFDSYKREFVLDIEMDDMQFDVDTSIPLGLILNELLTNSLKYAFDANGLVHVSIAIREMSPLNFELIYSDNGPGLSEQINLEKPSTLGLRLIKGLAGQLRGKIDYSFLEKSTFHISFKSIEINKKS